MNKERNVPSASTSAIGVGVLFHSFPHFILAPSTGLLFLTARPPSPQQDELGKRHRTASRWAEEEAKEVLYREEKTKGATVQHREREYGRQRRQPPLSVSGRPTAGHTKAGTGHRGTGLLLLWGKPQGGVPRRHPRPPPSSARRGGHPAGG